MALIYPTYLPNIATYMVMVQKNEVIFEVHDSYQKQTYRNRCYIYGANGKLSLNIPVHYSQNNRQNTKAIKIDNSSKWQSTHWKSIESAYKTSPFFEYYEDDLVKLFSSTKTYLLDFNFECIAAINSCLGYDMSESKSKQFTKTNSETDYRFLVNARQETKVKTPNYIQVFQDKHGFINNLSVLDLLCNEGPNALNFLKNEPFTL